MEPAYVQSWQTKDARKHRARRLDVDPERTGTPRHLIAEALWHDIWSDADDDSLALAGRHCEAAGQHSFMFRLDDEGTDAAGNGFGDLE